ncbi:OsmC family protein [Calditrichota bacterium]
MKKDFYANVTLIEGMHFHGESAEGLGALMDSKPAGEQKSGATPMELVLQAAGACSGMDVAGILRKRKFEIEKLEIKVEGFKREKHPRAFEKINLVYRARGKGITLHELQKAADLSVNKYCGVLEMVRSTAEINYTCELID